MRLLLILLLFTTPQEYFQLGITRHDAGDYAAARDALEKARELKHPAPILLPLRLARTYARLGEREKAFEHLKTAIDRGYGQVEQLNAENDFLTLREDPRWAGLVASARLNQHPCRNAPEYRQFDFWLGEWDVEANGQKIARSSIQLILDECVIFENYEATGYSGKSLTAWDAGEQRWEQHYTDTAGGSRSFTGKFENGKLVMLTEFEQQGAKVMTRMTYSKEGPDRVRQYLETSLDGGKTWAAGYDGMYVRRR
jgi:tetratricopeptide (TPR) repeat protein